MRTGRGILAGFAAVAMVQLAVPVAMIAQRETTLRLGRAYKFRTAPLDPYDAFRGRYVWLGFEQNCARWHGEPFDGRATKGFALVETGQDGFAVIQEVTLHPPRSGDYVQVGNLSRDWETNSLVRFSLPFDRFYMQETKAPATERAYREHSNRRSETNHNTYAVVRIRSGDAVMEDLCVDGQPIADFLREQPK